MNSKITFFNLGNADTTLIRLGSGKNILWDYANMQGEKHCDLPKELNRRVPKKYFDAVCFTHGDEDHVKGMSEYFYLEHAKAYQSDDRKKITDLWVPAALFLESSNEYCDDAKVLKAEAKHRFLIMKKGIKVFSKPDELKKWIESEGVKFSEVEHLIVDAGKLVPGWNKNSDGIEFFVHSPFKGHVDDTEVIDRNNAAIIVQAVFGNKVETKLMLGSDADSENLKFIVKITKRNGNPSRLLWDIFHLCHHCSYKAINKDEKGKTKTTPIEEVKWLMETQGQQNCFMISPSEIIPSSDTDQPPHKQGYNYYKADVADKKNGAVKVTMEHPTKDKPEPMEFIIDDSGVQGDNGLTDGEKLAGAAILTKTSSVSGNWCPLK
jgi:hypothetical protein